MSDTVTVTEERTTVVSVGVAGPPGAPAAAGNVLAVSIDGDDATGSRESLALPFVSLTAARDASLAGDTIVVWPGSYTCSASLAKDGVNWHFMPGATVTRNDDAPGGIWDDGGAAMTFRVTGAGDFTRSVSDVGGNANVVKASHASSDIAVAGRAFTFACDADSGETFGIHHAAGRLAVAFDTLTTSGVSSTVAAVWWGNGELRVNGNDITAGVGYGIYSSVNAAPTGDAIIRLALVHASGNSAIYSSGTNAAAAMWVHALIVKADSNDAVVAFSLNKLYVTAQKLFGRIKATSGLLYVESDKVTAIAAGTSGGPSLYYAETAAADARISVRHWDANGFGGESIKIIAGTSQLRGGDLIGGATTKGVEVTGGTLRLTGARVDTTANNATNPVTKSGGTLILDGATTLVAEATRDSIAAATPQNVKSYGAWANKAVNANVTIQGAMNVNANVS